jgi:hypothetical protein
VLAGVETGCRADVLVRARPQLLPATLQIIFLPQRTIDADHEEETLNSTPSSRQGRTRSVSPQEAPPHFYFHALADN